MAQIIRGSRIILKENPVALIMLLMLSCLCGCNHSIRNNTLKGIQTSLDDLSLTEAKASEIYHKLSDINADSLNEGERSLLAFLKIKAADKAYVHHNNDTVYLKVKDYFRHHNTDLYPEVLYYGGRVYSDMGDYPTALQYFHEALEKLPKDDKNLNLRATIHSQRGQLLSNVKLRMYDQALEAFSEAIKIEKFLKDSLGLIYDYTAIGATYMHLNNYEKALYFYKKSQGIANKISPENKYYNSTYMAYIYSQQGDYKNALHLIKEAMTKDDSINWVAAKGYAIDIYLKAGIRDTAYQLARELATSEDSYNREYGYEMFLSPELISFVKPDSLPNYLNDYKKLLDSYYETNQNQAALIQNASYNYKLHDTKRKEAEEKSERLQKMVGGVLIAFLIVVICIFYWRNRYHKNLIRLHNALDNIEELKKIIGNNTSDREILPKGKDILQNAQNPGHIKEVHTTEAIKIEHKDDEEEVLKSRIRTELECLGRDSLRPYDIPVSIIESDAYKHLQEKLDDSKVIAPDNDLWNEIEKSVLSESPNLKRHLLMLTGGHLKTSDYQMALLIKLGMNPTQISILVGRSKSTISYRREKLCLAIFGEKIETKTFDYLIRLL